MCVWGGGGIWGNPGDDKGTWGSRGGNSRYVERRAALGCLGGGSRAAAPGRSGEDHCDPGRGEPGGRLNRAAAGGPQ